MAISSINIQPATAHCFAHNDRSDKVTYLIDNSKENECSAPAPVAQKALAQMISEAEKYRKENGLRAMKSDTVKAVEAVVNLNATHKLADVERLAEKIETEFGFRAVQIAVHRDEGKSSSEKNYHAHIVMCNLTPEGKTIQRTLGREGLKKLQDITARELGMERGKSSNVKHIDHKIYRVVAQEKENLLEKIDELQKENLAQGYTLKEYQARIVGLEGANTELRKELHAQNREINKTQDLEEKERKITELEAKMREIEGKNIDLSKSLETVRSLRSSDQTKILELSQTVEDLKKDILEISTKPQISPAIVQEYSELKEKYFKSEKTIEALQGELQEAKRPSAAVDVSKEIEEAHTKIGEMARIATSNAEVIEELEKAIPTHDPKKVAIAVYNSHIVADTGLMGKFGGEKKDTDLLIANMAKEFQKRDNLAKRLLEQLKKEEITKMSVSNAMKNVVESTKKRLESIFNKITGKSIPEVQKERTEKQNALKNELQHTIRSRGEILKDAKEIGQGFLDKLKEQEKEPEQNRSRGMER